MTIKKLNKSSTIVIIGSIMILVSLFIMRLWVNDFESNKRTIQAQITQE